MKQRQILVTWIVVYPMITTLFLVLEPVLNPLPVPLRTLVVSAVMVPTMVLWAMPFATKRLSRLLAPERN
ncbi:MAG: hypothetical protein AAGG11_05715 [Pseudomonadota bacterium]